MKKPEHNARGYVSDFMVNALRDKPPIPVHREIERMGRFRLFLMTLPTVSDFIGIPYGTLRRRVRNNKSARAAAILETGRTGAVVYPYWVLHEVLSFSEGSNDGGDDENDNDQMFGS